MNFVTYINYSITKTKNYENFTIRSAMLSLALLVFTISFSTDANAQYKTYGENIVVNGDFSSGSDNWVIEGGLGTVTHDDTLKFKLACGQPMGASIVSVINCRTNCSFSSRRRLGIIFRCHES